MSSNFPTGFFGFRARMDAMAEMLGGDALAKCAVERVFAEDLESVAKRSYDDSDRPFTMHLPHHAGWTRATEADFDRAAEIAEGRFLLGDEFQAAGEVDYGAYKIVWGLGWIVRIPNPNRGAALLLATSRGSAWSESSDITVTEEGLHLAGVNNDGFRTRYRRVQSKAALLRTFESWANKEFRS